MRRALQFWWAVARANPSMRRRCQPSKEVLMSVTPSGAKQAFLLTDKDLKTLHCVDVSTTSRDMGEKIPFLASKLLSLT